MGNIDYNSNHVLTLKCLQLLRNIRNYVNG